MFTTVDIHGEVSEWSKVLDSKSSVPQGTVGSNPTLSASKIKALRVFAKPFCFARGDLMGTLRGNMMCEIMGPLYNEVEQLIKK